MGEKGRKVKTDEELKGRRGLMALAKPSTSRKGGPRGLVGVIERGGCDPDRQVALN